jgi:YcxB-like protein
MNVKLHATMQPPPVFAFTAQPTLAQMAAAVRLVSRRTLIWLLALGLLGVVCGLMVGLDGGDPGVAFGMITGGLTLGLLLPWLVSRTAAKNNARLASQPITYRIDEQGVWSATALSEGLIRWPMVTRVDEVRGMLVVRVDKNRFIPVPVDQLPPEATAELTAFIRGHLGLAGAPVVRRPGT